MQPTRPPLHYSIMEEDFTGGAIHDQPTRRQWSVDPPFDARIRQLVRDWDASESPELIEEMIVTALKIARDHMSVADLKLINRSIKEMRNAAKVFAPFQHLRKVAIFGSARTPTDRPEYEVAKDFAREMVAHNFMVVTGGGDGIMGAAQRGARFRVVSRWLWHPRRSLRGAHTDANRESPYHSCGHVGSATWKLLGGLD